MRILIEGPQFVGRWTEVVADALASSGHQVEIHYHNRKALSTRLRGALDREGARARQKDLSNDALLRLLYNHSWDLLLSIQGHIRAQDILSLKTRRPSLRVVFWWGDILTANGRNRVLELCPCVDLVMSSLGAYPIQAVSTVGMSIAFGLIVGTPQCIYLRRYVANAALWIGASALGWGLTTVATGMVIEGLAEQVLFGLIPAVCTGLTFLYFLHETSSEPPAERAIPA